MKLLHLKGKDIYEYISIDKIEMFQIIRVQRNIYKIWFRINNRKRKHDKHSKKVWKWKNIVKEVH